jgi:NAD(P)H-hydrate epimerase
MGPGLSLHKSTQKLVLKIISSSPVPLVIDADAINALAEDPDTLKKKKTSIVLTPHPGEMAKLTKTKKNFIEKNRDLTARTFADKYNCTLLLKGPKTLVASPGKKTYKNTTGNPGMATAGSGDVLTGMIAAFIGQGMSVPDAASKGAYFHGKAGDLAARSKSMISLIASDIIDKIPAVLK